MRNSIRIPICRVKSVAAFLIGKAAGMYDMKDLLRGDF